MDKVNFKLSLWNWVVIFFKGKFGGGLSAVFEYILNIFNDNVLSKVPADDLKKYAGIVVALAEFGEKILNLYVMDIKKQAALTKTVDTLKSLAEALSDGKVTPDELEKAINDVIETVEAWKAKGSIKPTPEANDEVINTEEGEKFVPGEDEKR